MPLAQVLWHVDEHVNSASNNPSAPTVCETESPNPISGEELLLSERSLKA